MILNKKKYETRILNQIEKDHDKNWTFISDKYKKLSEKLEIGVRHLPFYINENPDWIDYSKHLNQ